MPHYHDECSWNLRQYYAKMVALPINRVIITKKVAMNWHSLLPGFKSASEQRDHKTDLTAQWRRIEVPQVVFFTRVAVWVGCALFALGSPWALWVGLGAAVVTFGGLLAHRWVSYEVLNQIEVALDIVAISLAIRLTGGLASNAYILYGGEALSLTAYSKLRWSVLGGVVIAASYALVVGAAALSWLFAFRVFGLVVFILSAGFLGQAFIVQQVVVRRHRRQMQQMASLRAIQDSLLREEPLETLLDTLLTQGLQVLDLDVGYIGILESDGLMHMRATVGLPATYQLVRWDPAVSEPTRTAVSEGHLTFVSPLEAYTAGVAQTEVFQSLAVCPLYDGGHLLGVLAMGSRSHVMPEEETRPILESLAALASGQIRFDRERQANRKRGRLLTSLERVGKIVNGNLKMRTLLPILHQAVAEELQTDVFFVVLRVPGDENRAYMAYLYDEGEVYEPETFDLTEDGPTTQVLKTGEAGLFNQPSTGVQIGSQRDPIGMLVAPLKHESRVIGAISAQSYRSPYDQDQLEFLSAVASQATVAVQNAQLYQHTEQVALTDHLTGLGNARGFSETLTRLIEDAVRFGSSLSLLLIDSDSLKAINDRYGHAAGDAHLQHLADVIRKNVRGKDAAFRYAGDEFVVLLTDTEINSAVIVAERICLSANQGLEWQGQMVSVSVSIGVAEYEMGMTVEDLFVKADQAMYRAKETGKNRVALLS